jgi:hypothetical protein
MKRPVGIVYISTFTHISVYRVSTALKGLGVPPEIFLGSLKYFRYVRLRKVTKDTVIWALTSFGLTEISEEPVASALHVPPKCPKYSRPRRQHSP